MMTGKTWKLTKINITLQRGEDILNVVDKEIFTTFSDSLNPGDYVKATLTKVKDIRTLRQNRLYWRVLNIISDNYADLDLDASKWHKYFKSKWLTYIENILGEDIQDFHSSADLTKQEFTDYIEKIATWAVEKMEINVLSADDRLLLKE